MTILRCRVVSVVLAGASAVGAGCGWVNVRSDFERDPFVMSHLTHSKEDPLFAVSDSAADFDREELVKSASISRKDRRSSSLVTPSGDSESPGFDRDYRWLRGRLGFRRGKRSGWYIRYANSANDDKFGGELRIDSTPRLGLIREGDQVYVEGQVVNSDPNDPRYRVATIALLDP